MSILSLLAQSRNLFLVTGIDPLQGTLRVSAPVFNPLFGFAKGQRRVFSWQHLRISGVASPGQVVELKTEQDALRICRSISFGGVTSC